MDGLLVTFDMPENVLEDDNGIIHDQTRRERKPGKGQRVERKATQPEECECRNDGNRNRQRDNHR